MAAQVWLPTIPPYEEVALHCTVPTYIINTNMKKTIIALMALAGVAAADTYTSSTPDKNNQGNYYGFTLAPANATYLTTDIPTDYTDLLNLDSITIQTRAGGSSNAARVAVYEYTGDSTTGVYLGVSEAASFTADTAVEFSFDAITIDPTKRYQFLFVNTTATDLATFDQYKAASMTWGVAVTNGFSGQIPGGWGTYKSSGLNSWEGNYVPVVSLTMSTPGATESVPEPATATLSLLALAGLCARRRR